MASKSEISALIKSYIRANGNKEITGPILQKVLLKMLDLSTDTSGMNYRGTKTVEQINALTSLSNGDFYTCADAGTITRGDVTVSAGDFVIYNSEEDEFHTTSQFVDMSGKQDTITGAATTVTEDDLTPLSLLASDGDGKIAASSVTVAALTASMERTSANTADIATLTSSVSALSDSVDEMDADIEKLSEDVEDMEGTVSDLDAKEKADAADIVSIQADIEDLRQKTLPDLTDGTAEININSAQVHDGIVLTEDDTTKVLTMTDGELTFDGKTVAGITLDDEVTATSEDGVKSSGIYQYVRTAIANKADKSDLPTALSDLTDDLPKDDAPTEGSDSYVTSGTVYTALSDKLDKSNPTGTGSLTLGRHPSGDASTYVARFGNGTSDDDTSNAMQCDYNGNFKVSGEVTDGSGNVLSKKVDAYSMTETEESSFDWDSAPDGWYAITED